MPSAIKLENILEPQELINWGFERRAMTATRITPPSELPQEQQSFEIQKLEVFKADTKAMKTPLSFQMRPGQEFAQHFPRLYQMTNSSDHKDRQYVERLIAGMAYDPYPNNRGLRTILQAALIVANDNSSMAGYKEAKAVVKCMDDLFIRVGNMHYHGLNTKPDKLNNFLMQFLEEVSEHHR